MSIIIPYTLIAVVSFIVALQVPNNTQMLIDGKRTETKKLLSNSFFILVVLIVLAFTCFRRISAPSIDEWIYRPRINYFRDISFSEALEMGFEPFLEILYWIAAKLFITDQGSLIITSAVTVIFLLVGLRKHSYDFSIALLLLFLTGCVYSTFNGVSQWIASAVFCCFFDLVYEKKFWKFLIVVLICSMFHMSSVVLIPFYFVVNCEFGKPKSCLYAFLFLAAILVVYDFIPVLFPLLGISDYVETVINGHHGVKALSVIASVLPAVFAFILKKSTGKFDKITNACANMLLLEAMISVASIRDVYIARFDMFLFPFVAIFFSRAKVYIKKKEQPLIYFILFVAYFAWLYFKIREANYYFNFSF